MCLGCLGLWLVTVDAVCEFAAGTFRALNAFEEVGSGEDHVDSITGSVSPGVTEQAVS